MCTSKPALCAQNGLDCSTTPDPIGSPCPCRLLRLVPTIEAGIDTTRRGLGFSRRYHFVDGLFLVLDGIGPACDLRLAHGAVRQATIHVSPVLHVDQELLT